MDTQVEEYWRTAPDDPIEALFGQAPVLAQSMDLNGTIQRVTQVWADLLGYRIAEVEGCPATAFLTDESGQVFENEVLVQLRELGNCRNVPLTALRPDGAEVPLLMSATVQLDRSAQVVRTLAVFTDTSEARITLAALRRKAMEAQEASQAKSRFLAAMSHEIRTPMNAILGFAQLLELSDIDESKRAHVEAILSAGNALMTLLRDLLDLSQVEAGFMRIENRSMDLIALLEEIATFWCAAAQDRGLAFEATWANDLPRTVLSDPLRIRQVLNNYLGNAVKFTPAGRVILRVGYQTLHQEDPTIRFEVCDTGPGIDPVDTDRLFAPFVQASSEPSGRASGWGLGLSICSNIATAMGAEVSVESQPGQGACFRFDLPARRVVLSTAQEKEPATSPLPKTGPLRILLAEDDILNQDVMRGLLKEMGHSVDTVGNGFEAVDAALTRPYDVVIMDVMMPGLDGVAATQRIRERSDTRSTPPIIGCSAHVDDDARRRYLAAGMFGFIPKPVGRAPLERVLAEAAQEAASTTDRPDENAT